MRLSGKLNTELDHRLETQFLISRAWTKIVKLKFASKTIKMAKIYSNKYIKDTLHEDVYLRF